jgi:hypothetical protein
MTVNGYDVVRMVRNLREPDVTPKTAARAADLMDELAEELAGTREELGDLNSLLGAVMGPMSTKPIRGQRCVIWWAASGPVTWRGWWPWGPVAGVARRP